MSRCNSSIIVADEGWRKDARSQLCRSWTCQTCAPIRKTELIAKILSGRPRREITLTSRRDDSQTATQAAEALSRALTLLTKRVRREYGQDSFEFIAIMEATKLGWPHYHLAQHGKFIPWQFLSDTMGELINSPRVRITELKDQKHAARYFAKYIGKGPERFGELKRYRCSKRYDRSEYDKAANKKPWMIESRLLDQWCRHHEHHGWHVLRSGLYAAKATAPGVHEEVAL